MIYLYPANKMENLLVLLDKIQHISPLDVFTPETIVVQNPGMQHWLNLSLAKQRGISMNMRYALPAQFLWKLMRELASDEDVPEQSLFSREVLTWRIFALLAQDIVCDDVDFVQATGYWQSKDRLKGSEQSSLKRYQLACQLADLYEQYLVFRPQWIDTWHQGSHSLENSCDAQDNLSPLVLWQAKLWQLLIQEQSYNPLSLMKAAIKNIESKQHLLPKRLSFFGINAMAPMWLNFINALSEHTDVHFFHLNPCYAYWGDIVTEKQAVKALDNWVEGYDDISKAVGNPLLANFGQQGREFLAMLQQYTTINIDVFDDVPPDNSAVVCSSVLNNIQQDILSLTDKRQSPIQLKDDSITITSCHSALREVQGLHDWLLHQFNDNNDLTPKDVLVMCPQIESYAPYVNAVFARGWQDIGNDIPPLPCSIADRSSLDSEPLIAAFSELLTLPDSRFHVSQLIALLRLEAMQVKFDITIDELAIISVWLEQATIHWGIDQKHKQNILDNDQANERFTWQQGLSRLIRGFAFGDVDCDNLATIYQNQTLLPDIEGDNAQLLGKLMLIIEQLQFYAQQLSTDKTATQWQSFLLTMLDDLFDCRLEHSFPLIVQAIESLVEYVIHAQYDDKIALLVIQDFLNHHFSQPDPGRQFMVGQVTFCSMMPMRSIPFKVIAVLGLNDGEFPRQRQTLGFDLMAITPAKLGDRSRRGDDRYLFLEAIISARESLYLSFQGRNIKNNSEKQPSLLLKELMEYLVVGYGWNFSTQEGNQSDIRQLAMQAFSEKNYQGKYKGFDKNWLTLKKPQPVDDSKQKLLINASNAFDHQTLSPLELSIDQLVSFYQHPAKMFAQQQLNLFFDQKELQLDDSEPFDHDRLQTYLLRQQLLDVCLTPETNETELQQQKLHVLKAVDLGGKFPDLPTTAAALSGWLENSETFARHIIEQHVDNPVQIDRFLSLLTPMNNGQEKSVILSSKLAVKDQQLVFYRSSSAKTKDLFALYLHQLFVQVYQQNHLDKLVDNHESDHQQIMQIKQTTGFYFNTKTKKADQYIVADIDEAKSKLTDIIMFFYQGQQQALLLNGDLAEQMFKRDRKGQPVVFQQQQFEDFWQNENIMFPLGNDPYIRYFWPQCPDLSEHLSALTAIYQAMFTSLVKVKASKKSKGAK